MQLGSEEHNDQPIWPLLSGRFPINEPLRMLRNFRLLGVISEEEEFGEVGTVEASRREKASGSSETAKPFRPGVLVMNNATKKPNLKVRFSDRVQIFTFQKDTLRSRSDNESRIFKAVDDFSLRDQASGSSLDKFYGKDSSRKIGPSKKPYCKALTKAYRMLQITPEEKEQNSDESEEDDGLLLESEASELSQKTLKEAELFHSQSKDLGKRSRLPRTSCFNLAKLTSEGENPKLQRVEEVEFNALRWSGKFSKPSHAESDERFLINAEDIQRSFDEAYQQLVTDSGEDDSESEEGDGMEFFFCGGPKESQLKEDSGN